jgi:UDP-N-acetylglucosamine diphosphorylase/glucosamine-1-phosphate N-acetyltransferase
MHFYLFDLSSAVAHLWPFTLSRSPADIPVGMLSLRAKWDAMFPEKLLGVIPTPSAAWHPHPFAYDTIQYPAFCIASQCFPSSGLLEEANGLLPGQSLWQGDQLLAFCANNLQQMNEEAHQPQTELAIQSNHSVRLLDRIWKIQEHISVEFKVDFALKPLPFSPLPEEWGNRIIGPPDRIHMAPGAKIFGSILNTTTGDIYVDKDAEIMEGCMVRGPFYLGQHSVLKMGTRIYGPVAAGKFVKLGGEIGQSQIFDFSNKGHEGYLGNSVIGSWCNLGADTNNSNLKNNYAEVKLWNQALKSFESTGLQFCGLFMGDHSKTGINTMFNTGTVVGFSCNIFGSGFPRNMIPSFQWGGASGLIPYKLSAAKETARAMMGRRNIPFDEDQAYLFQHILDLEKGQ